jgi:hypothetical protein
LLPAPLSGQAPRLVLGDLNGLREEIQSCQSTGVYALHHPSSLIAPVMKTTDHFDPDGQPLIWINELICYETQMGS